MQKIRTLFQKYREQIAYLFFGGVATAVNLGVYGLLHILWGVHSDLANVAAWVAAVIVAYVTNRIWVFRSHTRGMAWLREIGTFVAGRMVTGLMDQGIMHVSTQIIGPRWIPLQWNKQWDMGMKAASNVLVIVLNYVFSKRIIFRKRPEQGAR